MPSRPVFRAAPTLPAAHATAMRPGDGDGPGPTVPDPPGNELRL